MRLLLIAYEFPPVQAAQALRWYYLANELARRGHHIDVVTADLADIWRSELALHSRVQVFRVFPGPFMGAVSALLRRTAGKSRSPTQLSRGAVKRKGSRIYERLRDWLNRIVFPDLRTEWYPFALGKLRRLLNRQCYDALITSHEPGVDMILGLRIKRQYALPWVADLGDLLGLADLPKAKVAKEVALEEEVCEQADLILATNANAVKLLQRRHALPAAKICLVSQGFQAYDMEHHEHVPTNGKRACHLVYTGSLYRELRNPEPFLKVVTQLNDVTLTIAGYVDFDLSPYMNANANLKYVRFLTHDLALALQKQADVLINWGNRNKYQVPGKFFEYLGACRPILHLSMSSEDILAGILAEYRRGVVVDNKESDIQEVLVELIQACQKGTLDTRFDLSLEAVKSYSWQSQANVLHQALTQTIGAGDARRHT